MNSIIAILLCAILAITTHLSAIASSNKRRNARGFSRREDWLYGGFWLWLVIFLLAVAVIVIHVIRGQAS